MTLSQLPPGTRFHVQGMPHVCGTLREVHGGGAVVLRSRPKTREFDTADGRHVVFHDPGHRTETWAAATVVVADC